MKWTKEKKIQSELAALCVYILIGKQIISFVVGADDEDVFSLKTLKNVKALIALVRATRSREIW